MRDGAATNGSLDQDQSLLALIAMMYMYRPTNIHIVVIFPILHILTLSPQPDPFTYLAYPCTPPSYFNLSSILIAYIKSIIIYLFSVNTFTPIERCAIIFVIAQVGKILIGQKIQKLQNRARCNRSLIGQ